MTEREIIIEEGTVQEDNVEGRHKGWTRNDTSPSQPPEISDISSLVEQLVQARISDVIKERDELKEKVDMQNNTITHLSEENKNLRDAAIDLTLRNRELLKKRNKSQSTTETLQVVNVNISGNNGFDFKYDATNFVLAEPVSIDSIFLKLQNLAQKTDAYGNYFVDCASAIIPIFIIITTDERIDKIYRYKGNLESFCKEWNCNVAAYISDEKRSKELTCDYNSIKAIINRAPFKDSSIVSWQRMFDEGKNKKILNRAINIKVQMEKLFAKN
jgi:hypothetical protein